MCSCAYTALWVRSWCIERAAFKVFSLQLGRLIVSGVAVPPPRRFAGGKKKKNPLPASSSVPCGASFEIGGSGSRPPKKKDPAKGTRSTAANAARWAPAAVPGNDGDGGVAPRSGAGECRKRSLYAGNAAVRFRGAAVRDDAVVNDGRREGASGLAR